MFCWAGLHVTVDAIMFDALRRLVTIDLTTKRPAEDGEYLDRFVIGDARKVARAGSRTGSHPPRRPVGRRPAARAPARLTGPPARE